MKILVFDSSTIISLALNNLLNILERLHENFEGKFIITEDVKREVIEKPIQIKKFELEALMINELMKKGILEMPESIPVSSKDVKEETSRILQAANNSFIADSAGIKLLSSGEGSCIALGEILKRKDIEHALAIDERTARMLIEKPENLKMLLEKKLHTSVIIKKGNLEILSNQKIIRSAELCYLAYKRRITGIEDGTQLIDAMLYGTKYKGCAISSQEIEEIKRIV